MPGYQNHLLGYFLIVSTLIIVAYHYELVDSSIAAMIVAVFTGAVYTLLPDVDTPSSKMRRLVAKIFLAIIIASLVLYIMYADIRLIYLAIGLSMVLYILWFVKHRGIFHNPLVGIILASPLYLIDPIISAFAFVGFFTHLVMDREVFR